MDLRDQLQEHLGAAYRLERELGGGGMSRVFVAEEIRLGRQVVIKVLSPDLAQGLNVERFEREIRLAASLQQAQIVPLLTAGEVNGIPYFTMPYVDGESVRARLSQGRIPISEVVMILRDVARALAYAHARGVVHRDIKPDNVLLSGGTAVVTDFGIAKAISASRTGAPGATLTQLGTSIGTPAYMAPEQVAGDPDLDHRVDLYALGCMGYELLTGQQPFANRTPQKMLAAHLSEAVPLATALRPDTPPELAQVIVQLMAKDPAQRPQSATEVLRAVDTVTTSSPTLAFSRSLPLGRTLFFYAIATAIVLLCAKAAIVGIGLPDWVLAGAIVVMGLGLIAVLVTAYVQRVARHTATATPTLTPGGTMSAKAPSGTMATMAMKAAPHVTWRRTWRGGLLAGGAFILIIGLFMASRAFGIGPWASLAAAGKLGQDDRIVLADLTAPAADSGVVAVVGEAIRAALSQSNALHLVEPADVANVLQQMKQPRDLRLSDPALLHEVATRANARAVLGGRLAPLGTGYVVSLDLTAADGGAMLASFQGTANSSQDLLPVIDKLTRQLRGKAGESLRKVQQSIPLAQATTTSLEALRKYSEAVTAHDIDADYTRAVALEREALALDTTFALAWRKLGISLSNANAPEGPIDSAIVHAFHYADKLPERERQLAIGSYYATYSAALDRGKALAAYRAAFIADSSTNTAATDIASLFVLRRQYDSAVRYARAAWRISPGTAAAGVLAQMFVEDGELDSSRAILAANRVPIGAEPIQMTMARYLLALASGRSDSARAVVTAALASPASNVRSWAAITLANVDAVIGQASRSDSLARVEDALVTATAMLPYPAGVTIAYNDILIRNRIPDGLAQLDAVVASPAWAAMSPADRPMLVVISLYALAGKPDRAQSLFDEEIATDPYAKAPDFGVTLSSMRAQIALARGKYDDAIREFRSALVAEDGLPAYMDYDAMFGLAHAFDLKGEADSSRIYFERYLAISPASANPTATFMTFFYASPAAADKRLGELYDAAGHPSQALKYYGAFADQWKNADPDLQPVVTGVKKRMAELAAQERH
ncbi:MAG TPA: protein kinase [Gemmatimonadales bacterium]|jgi:tetratricopeptide (TPR) repeat protein